LELDKPGISGVYVWLGASSTGSGEEVCAG